MTWLISTTEYTSFDILGRVTAHKQTTDGGDPNGYTTGYTYTLAGALDTETYPSGRVVKNVLDNNGGLNIVQSKKNLNFGFHNYAQNFTYNAVGAMTSMQLGNGRWESTVFNSRLQPTQIALGVIQNSTDLLDLEYGYGTTNNNGNILSQTITVPTVGQTPGFAAVQTYTYDSLNRINDAVENITPVGGSSSQSWKQAFTYDRYGNRNFDEEETTTLPKNCGSSPNFTVCVADKKIVNPSVDASNNRLSSSDDYVFDDSGNTIEDAQGRQFTYDAENKQVAVKDQYDNTIGQYFYDGDGKRVKKYVPSTGELTIFVYDASGKLIGEYSTEISQTPKVSYTTDDHLSSPRIVTDENGMTISRVGVDSDGYLTVDTAGPGDDIISATEFLTDAINSTDPGKYFNVEVTNNNPDVGFGDSQTYAEVPFKQSDGSTVSLRAHNIRLDFGDTVLGSSDAKASFLNLVFAHEVAHWYPERLFDPEGFGKRGRVVNKINEIRLARGLPLRIEYVASRIVGGAVDIHMFGEAVRDPKTGDVVRGSDGVEIETKTEGRKIILWIERKVKKR